MMENQDLKWKERRFPTPPKEKEKTRKEETFANAHSVLKHVKYYFNKPNNIKETPSNVPNVKKFTKMLRWFATNSYHYSITTPFFFSLLFQLHHQNPWVEQLTIYLLSLSLSLKIVEMKDGGLLGIVGSLIRGSTLLVNQRQSESTRR